MLPFYLAYRALVRAKIARLRAAQLGAGAAKDAALAESRGYLRLARSYAEPPRPALIITCGLSGCGKTAISQALLETIGAVRVRSDVERKRLHGVAALARSEAEHRARTVFAGGDRGDLRSPACARARHPRRGPYRDRRRDVSPARASRVVPALARGAWRSVRDRRLRSEGGDAARAHHPRRDEGVDASDADLAVLAHQIATREPLTAAERAYAVAYDAEAPLEAARAPSAWAPLAARLAARRKHRAAAQRGDDGAVGAL